VSTSNFRLLSRKYATFIYHDDSRNDCYAFACSDVFGSLHAAGTDPCISVVNGPRESFARALGKGPSREVQSESNANDSVGLH
jgi:hypothetical protein